MMNLRNRRAVGKDDPVTGSKVLVIGVAVAVAMLVTIILVPSVTLANDGDIRFTGTVTDRYQESVLGARWWHVTVEEVISGPTPCPELAVRLITAPPFPWGYFDDDIAIGDTVDVYGSYNSTDCSVSLNGNGAYHITKIPVQAPTLAPLGIAALVVLLTLLTTSTLIKRKQR